MHTTITSAISGLEGLAPLASSRTLDHSTAKPWESEATEGHTVVVQVLHHLLLALVPTQIGKGGEKNASEP